MTKDLEQAISLVIRALEGAIRAEVSAQLSAEVERTGIDLDVRIDAAVRRAFAALATPGAARAESPSSGRGRSHTTHEDAAAALEPLSSKEMAARMRGFGLEPAKRGPGRPRKTEPQKPKEVASPGATFADFPVGSEVQLKVGRADYPGTVKAHNSANEKVVVEYLNTKGETKIAERNPELLRKS